MKSLVGLGLGATGVSPCALHAQELSSGLYSVKQQQAVRKGLHWLASRIQEDGSFGPSGYQRNLAVMSLGGLAFLAGGHLPDRGPYGKHVSQLVDFVLQHAQQNGLIGAPNEGVRGLMYGHGFATLFLAQVYGVTRQRETRPALSNAIDLIVSTQNEEGGWRYQPAKKDADISVTVCQTMALRAARNAGFFVPRQTITAAKDYVLNL
ncbi:MAG: prenyltransferase/squalene oxidase repeat-containing protein, partial [Planctomycetota bacterium]|nr:prenyltransferase/squalene oxidase repeat-containing protein [Planctomycetota bacterium]